MPADRSPAIVISGRSRHSGRTGLEVCFLCTATISLIKRKPGSPVLGPHLFLVPCRCGANGNGPWFASPASTNILRAADQINATSPARFGELALSCPED